MYLAQDEAWEPEEEAHNNVDYAERVSEPANLTGLEDTELLQCPVIRVFLVCLDGKAYAGGDHKAYEHEHERVYEGNEGIVIVHAYAVVDPGAMVIKTFAAAIAYGAVFGTR